MVQRQRPGASEDRLSLPAIPQGVTSLKSGALSVVFHVPYESTERAFRLHELKDKPVVLTIEAE